MSASPGAAPGLLSPSNTPSLGDLGDKVMSELNPSLDSTVDCVLSSPREVLKVFLIGGNG